MPPSTAPHMPGTSARAAPFITWQVEVPMMATIWPGAVAFAAGGGTCASTLPRSEERRVGQEGRYWRDWSSDVCSSDLGSVHHMAGRGAHDGDHLAGRGGVRGGRGDMRVHVAYRGRDALGQPGPGCRLGGQRPGAGAKRGDRMLQLVGGEVGEPWVECAEEVAGWIVSVLPYALVAGGAGVPCLGAAQLPDDPVGGLDPALCLLVDLRVLIQQLERLGELPLRG